MKKTTGLDLSVISFGALVVVCILSGQLVVAAQGWRAGEAKANVSSQPNARNTSAAPVGSATKTHKSARAAKTNASVASAKKQKAKPSSTKATTAETQASRERQVDHNKNADPKATSTLANRSETKSVGSTRVAAASKAPSGRCDPDQDERMDLSGTYAGSVNYPNDRLSGDATLTITGNRFTLRTNSKTESGNITAVTTCSYTAVAMMFGEWRTPKPGEAAAPPLPMLSLTASRKGDQLTLKASPSERREFSFAPAAKK